MTEAYKMYDDDKERSGESIVKPEAGSDRLFVFGWAEWSYMEAEADNKFDYNIERFASPQFETIRRDCTADDLVKVTGGIETDLKDFWSDDEYDWEKLEWEFFGWKKSRFGARDNLIGILIVAGEPLGMLVVQATTVNEA